MKPFLTAADQLQATYRITGMWPHFEVTFESGDGRGRNSDYKQGVEVVLARLGAVGAVLTSARITSDRVRARMAEAGLDSNFIPRGFSLPLPLSGIDHNRLRRGLGHAGALIDSPPGTSGNTTRRMTLSVTMPEPPILASVLESRLASAEVLNGPASSGPPRPSSLAMIEDLAAIDGAMGDWLSHIEKGARVVDGKRLWLVDEAICLTARRSVKRSAALDVRLGVRPSGAPWAVEINAPKAAADANGATTVALDGAGHRVLIHQGWLRANPDSIGEVRGERFQRFSELTPVSVSGGRTPTPREWYVVANLDDPAELVRKQTGAFVHACARARLASLGIKVPAAGPPLIAADEKGGSFFKKAMPAQPEKEVLRLQGEVWLALRRILDTAGIEMTKLRHEAGYEVDGVIVATPSHILLEIKTGVSAANVYEGVGQLILYSQMMRLLDHRRILLLPGAPRPALVAAAEAIGLSVHSYDLAELEGPVSVEFSAEFLEECGVKVPGNRRQGPQQ